MFTAKSNIKTEAPNYFGRRKIVVTPYRSGAAAHRMPYRKFGFTLAEFFSTHFTGQRKCAFTLAEVLITLGIIGVVAAMTLPALINNYKKAQTVSQLKASYSILSQAIKLSEVTNGEVKYWNFNLSSEQFFEKYLKGYLKMQKTSTLGEAKKQITYKWINNEPVGGGYKEEVANSYRGNLANGSLFYVHSAGGYSTTLMVDINSYKNPNKVGIDMFHFVILPEYGLVPWGFATENIESNDPDLQGQASFGKTYDRDKLTGTSSAYACNAAKRGRWCTALIMSDGWQIKPDYPWSN